MQGKREILGEGGTKKRISQETWQRGKISGIGNSKTNRGGGHLLSRLCIMGKFGRKHKKTEEVKNTE